MTYLSANMPAPVPDIDDAPFWEAAARRLLVFQRCGDCRTHRHPPSPMCPVCQSARSEWTEAPSRGQLFTYTVTYVSPHPELRDRTPYIVALVCFPTLDHVRIVSNIVDAAPEELSIGADVERTWEPIGAHMYVPRFRLVKGLR